MRKNWCGTSRTPASRMQTGRTASPRYISWWTMGESNSRTPDANRVHCHCANGPRPKKCNGASYAIGPKLIFKFWILNFESMIKFVIPQYFYNFSWFSGWLFFLPAVYDGCAVFGTGTDCFVSTNIKADVHVSVSWLRKIFFFVHPVRSLRKTISWSWPET